VKKQKLLTPVRPNVGVELAYRRKLERLIDEMSASVIYWVSAAYKKNEPAMAQDAIPADYLRRLMKKLARRWMSRFDDAANELAEYFAKAASERSDAALKAILKRAGVSIEFKMTPAQRDILSATVNQNVSLIKSISGNYLAQVDGSVMRSVQTGRDLASLTKDLREHHGVSKRKAAMISRDQNNKATSAMNRARQIELGIKEAVWLHSAGGKEPRPKHVAFSGKRYDVVKGAPIGDKEEYVFPGQEINCRCVCKSVLPDLTAYQGI